MSVLQRLSRGEGPFWGGLKRAARSCLSFHIPANSLTRPFFRGCYRFHIAIREGLAWLLRCFWYEPLFRSQCEHVGVAFRMEQLPYLTGTGAIIIGDSVRLSGKSSFCFNNRHVDRPQICIGDRTFLGHNCSLIAGREIDIGQDCLIAAGVRIADQDGHPIDAARRRAGEPTPSNRIRPVRIGDDVWIGAGAVILKGVTIGDRAIVAGYAVVTSNVAADTVVAGNPARIVRRLTAPADSLARSQDMPAGERLLTEQQCVAGCSDQESS